MISIGLKLIKSKKLLIPAFTLFLGLTFLAFIDYWVGSYNKQLTGKELAEFISTQATQTTITALFCIIWMIQITVHLNNSGFYKTLLSMGWTRNHLFFYCLTQSAITIFILMFLNSISYSILSFFFGTNPIQLIIYTDPNALIAQGLFFFMISILGLTIAFLKPHHVIVLPVLIYWILEGWFVSFLHNHVEMSVKQFFPLGSIKLLVGENLLNTSQLIVIGLYAFIVYSILYLTIQKRMFV